MPLSRTVENMLFSTLGILWLGIALHYVLKVRRLKKADREAHKRMISRIRRNGE